jgi:release factor glutamine methyltransferase
VPPLSRALADAKQRLRTAGSDTASLDAEVLLSQVLGVERAALLAHPERVLAPEEAFTFEQAVRRRQRGEPVAYVVGRKEFFGLDLHVDRRVLIPRPETETLVERALTHLPGDGTGRVVADVGTGSGAIAVALAQAKPGATVYATDTSPDALNVARENGRRLVGEGRITFVDGALLGSVPERVDVLCANLPYIPTGDLPSLTVSVRAYEPWSALDGGPDGLDVYRALVAQLPEGLTANGVVIMECDPAQAEALLALALAGLPGARGEVVNDLAGDARVVEVRR